MPSLQFFVAFNTIADGFADKRGYRIHVSQTHYEIFYNIYQNCEFIKTKKDHKCTYNKTCKASSEMGAKPWFIILYCILNG